MDLRGGFRSLWKSRLVSALAITSLALAIAGNTAVFSIVSAMFLRPLPFEESENLVFLSDRDPANVQGILIESKENFFDLREQSESYDNLIAFTFASLGMERDAEPEPTSVMLASEGFFETVRWQPALGRAPLAEEEVAGVPPVAVLSHNFWTTRFAADPDILGSEFDLSGERFKVIGVLPEGTEFLNPNLHIFAPLRLGPPEPSKRGSRAYSILGRLASGVSLADADREMRTLSAALAA